MEKENKPDLLQDETLSQKLIKKGFWLYLFSYLIAPGGYLIRLMISNSPEITVADVGILYSIIGLVNFLNVYNDLGLTESLQYFLPKFWIRKEYNHIKTTIRLSLGTQILTSFLISGILRFGADQLGINYFHSEKAAEILRYFCFYFLGINLFQTLQSIFIAFQRTFDYQFVEFIKTWSTVIFIGIFFFSGNRSIGQFSLIWIIGLVIGLLIAGFLYVKNYRSKLMQGSFEWNKPMLKEYSQYALWSFVGLNVGNLFGQVIQQMVIYFLGAEAAGYYSNFLSLFMIGNILLGPIMSFIFPLVSELLEKKDYKKIGLLFSFFYSYFSIFVLSFSLIMMLFAPEICDLFFGSKYQLSGELLFSFALFQIFGLFSSFNFASLAGLGKISIRVRSRGIASIVVILFGILGIRIGGIYFSGLLYILGNFLLWFVSFLFISKYIKFKWDWIFIIKNGVILFAIGILIYYIKAHLGLPFLGMLIIAIVLMYTLLSIINKDKLKFLYQEVKNLKR